MSRGITTPPVRLGDGSDEAIHDLLMGRRIVEAKEGNFPIPGESYYTASGRIVLDDGTEVLVVPNEGGCSCGAGDYSLEHLATVDNIITDVRNVVETTSDDRYEPDQAYRIYVIADNVEINAMSVEGNDGNGYYGSGFELYVIRPVSEARRG